MKEEKPLRSVYIANLAGGVSRMIAPPATIVARQSAAGDESVEIETSP
jgi:hypothetical protein